MRSPSARARVSRALPFAVIAWSVACADASSRGPSPIRSERFDVRPDGLERLAIRGPGTLYMRPGRPIGAYDSFKLNRIDITFKDTRYSDSDEERIRAHVRSSLLRSMEATGLPIVDEPDECTLLVEVGILDIVLIDPIPRSGASTYLVKSWGEATIAQHLYDAETGAPLMRFAVRRQVPGGIASGASGGRDWRRIEDTLDRLLQDTQAAFLEGLPIAESPPTKPGCRGGIYELRKATG